MPAHLRVYYPLASASIRAEPTADGLEVQTRQTDRPRYGSVTHCLRPEGFRFKDEVVDIALAKSLAFHMALTHIGLIRHAWKTVEDIVAGGIAGDMVFACSLAQTGLQQALWAGRRLLLDISRARNVPHSCAEFLIEAQGTKQRARPELRGSSLGGILRKAELRLSSGTHCSLRSPA